MTRAAIVALAIAGIATSADARRWKPPRHPLPAAATTGVPTSIYDGDTFRFGKIPVRIWGIDAPEKDTRFHVMQIDDAFPDLFGCLGERVRYLAQCSRWTQPDPGWQADRSLYRFPNPVCGFHIAPAVRQHREPEKTFIDRVYLDRIAMLSDHHVETPVEVRIEFVIGRA